MKTIYKILFSLTVLVGTNFTVFTQTTNECLKLAVIAYEKGDKATAFKWFKKGAEGGDKMAQHYVAVCYLHGDNVNKDLKQVEFWALKSAEQEYADAQVLMGDLNFYELKNIPQAIYWWKKAADQNETHSMQQLANIYFNGIGVVKDEIEAFKWVEKAAENGDAHAMATMADAYIHGDRGLEIDYPKALQWYEKSIASGGVPANYIYNVGLMYNAGIGTDVNKQKAFELFSKAAELKYAQAYNDLAYFYANGYVVPQNFDIAMDMVNEAINIEPSSNRTCSFYDTKGEILLMQNKTDEAIQIWNKIKKEFPNQVNEMLDSPFVVSIKKIINEK